MNNTNILLEEYKLNSLFTLKNRIVMAPMTRSKAEDDFTPTAAMADYYARRAQTGLIITEGTIINSTAMGYPNTPGLYLTKHIEGWRKVTTKVHQNNGLIFNQIWHVGRVSHPNFLNGQLPVSSSATEMTGKINRSPDLVYGKSRAATLKELTQLIEDYATAAKNALAAGFDGIEIHGANGYLLDQFLHYHTNHRTDKYGITPENMARFALEVIKACGEMIGYERVGLRLSPGGYINNIIGDKRDADVFVHLLKELNNYSLAYIHTGNFNDKSQFSELGELSMTDFIRSHYTGTVIGCGSYTPLQAGQAIEANKFDLIALGRPFIANHDLIYKIQKNEDLLVYDATMLNTLE